MLQFEDHFSRMAQDYARNRPHYPAEFFSYLTSLAPGTHLAWDCGAGNGQAAIELARLFDRVIATDASLEQISQAFPHERIEYRVEPAEKSSLEAGSADLVTVGLAVHWFDLDRFYPEVRRVLVEGGILAVWSYHFPIITHEFDRILAEYYREILSDYWPERFHYVDTHYRDLPFPLKEVKSPEFAMTAEWDLNQFVGFMNSWSATRRYLEAQGRHPLQSTWPDMVRAWGGAEQKRSIRWPMYIRIGRF